MRRTLRCGADAILVECADAGDALRLWNRLDTEPPDGVREVVAGAQTVLLIGRTDEQLCEVLRTLPGLPLAHDEPSTVVIPVRYDGVDLDAVAGATHLTPEQVAQRHSQATYVVAFGGFVPGFAYLTGLDAALHLPRRDTPRTNVPAGSVAIAESYTGVYPSDTPGGWHLIGTTQLVVFDAAREPAATLRPGAPVRFERVG
jgi:KipI family sensor histidine kinase inhibitor